jgi:hypothetical protein
MPEIMSAKQLLITYHDPNFQKKLFLLENITNILAESIIADSYKEHYSKPSRWSAFRTEYNVLRNFMTRRMRYLKKQRPS